MFLRLKTKLAISVIFAGITISPAQLLEDDVTVVPEIVKVPATEQDTVVSAACAGDVTPVATINTPSSPTKTDMRLLFIRCSRFKFVM